MGACRRPPHLAEGDTALTITQQLLREIAERIRLRCANVGRCGNVEPCADCRRDAEDLERIARIAGES
jgi:hypothetical protein